MEIIKIEKTSDDKYIVEFKIGGEELENYPKEKFYDDYKQAFDSFIKDQMSIF